MPEDPSSPQDSSEPLSTGQWLARLADGDEEAATRLWREYYEKLVMLARKKLAASKRRVADEEDLALSVIENLCRGAEKRQFPKLDDRDDLWKLLFTIMDRKAQRYVATERRHKRGGGQVRGDSVLADGSDSPRGWHDVAVAREPSPAEATQVAESVERLLAALPDDELKQVAVLKMEGFTNEQIAEKLHCSPRTVKRRLQMIRTSWLASHDDVAR